MLLSSNGTLPDAFPYHASGSYLLLSINEESRHHDNDDGDKRPREQWGKVMVVVMVVSGKRIERVGVV